MRVAISMIVGLSVLAAGLCVLGMRLWEASGGTVISIHGYLALGLGALFTFLLTSGLMALVFYSNRRGFDDEVGATDEIDERLG